MASFRYQAREAGGSAVSGLIEAESRQGALEQLSRRNLFPSLLEPCAAPARERTRETSREEVAPEALRARIGLRGASAAKEAPAEGAPGGRVRRREVTAFTREMATLLAATIPIPQALEGLGEEEENLALRAVVRHIASSVRRGNSFSTSLEAHPRLFPRLYVSMVRVGEESGALEKVMADLADLLEQEDEVRGEVVSAVAYPLFVLVLGIVTTFVLLAFVLPRLFGMLEGMMHALPLPTLVLLGVSRFFQAWWPWVIAATAAGIWGLRRWAASPQGALLWDTFKLRLPVAGPLFRASALSRFARTLGTLARAGVSLLPALEIVRHTIGNRYLEGCIAQVAEETRGGDSLASPLRKLGLFPSTMVQMIAVGEETGKLDEMLLRVAAIEERQMRGRSRALISLLAPALILVVGALVGFVVIALLLPIFKMSQVVR